MIEKDMALANLPENQGPIFYGSEIRRKKHRKDV